MRMFAFALVVVLVMAGDALAERAVGLDHGVDGLFYSGAGAGLDVGSLQQLEFAFEYDPDLIDITAVDPDWLLLDHPPDRMQVDYLDGRVEVSVSYDSPVPLDANPAVAGLFSVNVAPQAELYDGERVRIRTVGLAPGIPPSWIDDYANPDDIKVSVTELTIIGDGGITCLAGDALGDGEIDAGDASTVLRIVAGLVEAPEVAVRCGADFNLDGVIHAGDGVLILRRAAGFDDTASRADVDPRVTLMPTAAGASLRVEGAGFAYGATLRVRSAGAVTLREIGTTSSALVARRVGADEGVIALADVDPISGDVLEFDIGAEGVGRLVIDELSLYGADGEALFEQSEPFVSELVGAPSMPRLALGNTPNPFNPMTTFWMELPRGGRATLDLYDMRGRKIATLVDEVRPAGRSEHRFDAAAMASGVYFARLETDAGATVHRITLLK